MANRGQISGFNAAGAFGGDIPNNANLTISTTHVRTGTSALRVDGVSGTNSRIGMVAASGGGSVRAFTKGWYYFISFPTNPRNLVCAVTSGPLSGYPEMRIDSTGHLSVGNNGTRLTTGTTALSLNTWYCIEFGMFADTRQASIRINGNQEIDWTAYAASGGPSSFTTLGIGAVDAVAGAFEYYLNDFEIDIDQWCGTGDVVTLFPSAIATDSAVWTANTGTKVAALASVDDDTTYLVSSTTTGSTSDIYFSFPALDPSVTQCWGTYISYYMKRDGASGGAIIPQRKLDSLVESPFVQYSSGASYAWSSGVNALRPSSTPVSTDLSPAMINSMTWGMRNQSANPTRISCIMLEVAVSTDVAARPHPQRAFVAGCDMGTTGEFTAAAGTVPTASTTRVRTGTYSIKATAAASTTSYVAWTTAVHPMNYQLGALFTRGYFYFDTLPTGGNIHFQDLRTLSTTWSYVLGVNPSGQLGVWSNTETVTSTPSRGYGTTVPTGQWVRIETYYQMAASGSTAKFKCWMDDVLVFDYSDFTGTTVTSLDLRWGITRSAATNSPVIYMDDIVVDYGARVRASKILDYVPTGIGTFTGTNWTTGAGSGLITPVTETPPDDDTTYLVTPNNSTDVISWAVGDLPSEATQVQAVRQSVYAKRDGASNGSVGFSTYTNNQAATNTFSTSGALTTATTSTTYAWAHKVNMVTPGSGAWTVGLFNGTQFYLRGNSTNMSRVSNARFTVEYVETSVGYKELSVDGYVKAPSRTKQVRCDGYLIDTTNKNTQITADAVVRNNTPPVAMPSRMYLTSTAPSYYSNLQNGDWDVVNVTVRKISGTSGGSIATRTVYKSLSTEQNALIYQGISDPIQAQVCQGSLKFMIATKEQRDAMDNVLMTHVWISQGNSDAIRGVLLDNYTWDLTDAEWSTNTDGLAKAVEVAANVTPVTAQTGDRLIVEIGYRSMGTFKGYGQLTYGGDYGTYGELFDGEDRTQGVAYLEWGGAIPIDSEPTTQPALREVDADGVVREQGLTTELTADGYVEAPASTQVDLDITADGVVVVFTTQTLEVTASAILQATPTTQITGTAILQDTVWTDVSADGLVQSSVTPEVTSDAIVQLQDITTDVTGSGIVVIQGQTLDVTSSAVVQVADRTTDLTTDGYIDTGAATRTLDVTSDAFVVATQTKEITGSGLLSSTQFGTKLYLTNLSPGWSGAVTDRKGTWNLNGFVKLLMSEDPTGTTGTQNRAFSETMSVNPTNVGILMAVSPQISSTTTIAGMLDFVIGARESSSNANMVFKIHAWVSVGNSTTVRGTLVNNWVDDSTNELDVTQGRGPRYQIPVSSVTAQAGDFIIVEVGVAAQNTATTSYTATMYYGATSPTAPDLTVGSFNYTSEFGYIAFTDNLPFLYQPAKVCEVAADGVIIDFTTKEVTATGLVKATQTKDLTGTGIVFATQTKDVTGSAILQATQQTQLTTDALILDGATLELAGDGIIQAGISTDISSDGLVLESQTLELGTSALVQDTFTLETDADAVLQATQITLVDIDGIVFATQTLDVDASATVFATQELDVSTDALTQVTIELAVPADGYLIFVTTRELATDGLVSATITTELGADAVLVGQPGTLTGQVASLPVLTCTPVVLAPLQTTARCIPPFTNSKRVLED